MYKGCIKGVYYDGCTHLRHHLRVVVLDRPRHLLQKLDNAHREVLPPETVEVVDDGDVRVLSLRRLAVLLDAVQECLAFPRIALEVPGGRGEWRAGMAEGRGSRGWREGGRVVGEWRSGVGVVCESGVSSSGGVALVGDKEGVMTGQNVAGETGK